MSIVGFSQTSEKIINLSAPRGSFSLSGIAWTANGWNKFENVLFVELERWHWRLS
jgi:hypothetical protein